MKTSYYSYASYSILHNHNDCIYALLCMSDCDSAILCIYSIALMLNWAYVPMCACDIAHILYCTCSPGICITLLLLLVHCCAYASLWVLPHMYFCAYVVLWMWAYTHSFAYATATAVHMRYYACALQWALAHMYCCACVLVWCFTVCISAYVLTVNTIAHALLCRCATLHPNVYAQLCTCYRTY